jgi:PAS domain S-box-containing protein
MTKKPTYEELARRVKVLERETGRRKQAEERIRHLNRVLRAIRNVNRVTSTEKNRDRLLAGVCEKLIETRGYHYAWIALLDDSGGLVTAVESGLGWKFLSMLGRLERGEFPDRMRLALQQPGVVVTNDPLSECTDCPLCTQYRGTGAMTVRLTFDGTVYGVMSASIPGEFLKDEEEQSLLQGLAGDITFALHGIDIEEKQREAQEELIRAEREKSIILDTVSGNIISYDPDLHVLWANKAASDTFGLPPDELVGKHCYEIMHQGTEPCPECPIREAHRTARPQKREMRTPDGKVWFVNTYPVENPERVVESIIMFALDITEYRRTEEALHESEENFRALAENAGDGVTILSEDGSHLYVNRSAAEIAGYSVRDLLRISLQEIIHPSERDKIMEMFRKRLRGEPIPTPYETVIIRKDGRSVPVEVSGARTTWHGRPADIVFSRDISKRRRAEIALRESEEFSSSLLKNAPSPIIVINPDTSVRYVNPALEELTGFSFGEIVGRKAPYAWWDEGSPGNNLEDLRVALHQGLRVVEYRFKKRNGERFWVEITSIPVKSNGELKYYLSNWVESTKRKQAEETLRESEERFRKTIENAPFGYYRVGKDGLWQYVNPQWEKMHGYSFQEIKGKSFETTQPEEVRGQAQENVRRALGGETITGEFGRRCKNGAFEYHTFNVQPVYKGGEIVAIEGFINDLTEQKRAEEYVRRLSHQLLQAQERERQMISRELHDRVAQDLSASKIVCDTLIDDSSASTPRVMRRISELSKSIEKTIMTVRDLSYDLRPPGLDEMGLVQTIYRYCEDFSERHDVNVDFQSAGLERLDLDGDTEINLYRMVQEGLNNVWKHADAGHVTIKLVATHPDIILRIEDNGKGFDVESRMVSTTDERRMGLRSMKERTTLLGGEMGIQSKPMGGTKICIRFPHLKNKGSGPGGPGADRPPQGVRSLWLP